MFARLTCEQCAAALAFAGVRSQTCPFCASPNIVDKPATVDSPRPELVVAFAHDQARASRVLSDWLGRWRLFTDRALARGEITELRGVYLPAYLYSAVAHTSYAVEIAEHYTETETYEVEREQRADIDGKGEKVTRTREVTRTEFRSLTGTHVGYVTDVLVSASRGLDDATLHDLQPYDFRQLRRFTPAVTVGWIHEEHARSRASCHTAAHHAATDTVGAQLRAFMPGDGHSDLTWRTKTAWESLVPVLVPVWLFVVRYRADRPPVRVAINGQTGKVVGAPPIVWWKVALALALVAAIAALIIFVLRGDA